MEKESFVMFTTRRICHILVEGKAGFSTSHYIQRTSKGFELEMGTDALFHKPFSFRQNAGNSSAFVGWEERIVAPVAW